MSEPCEIVPLYPWVTISLSPQHTVAVTVAVTATGPTLSCEAGVTASELLTMGQALIDAGRALRNGDDPAEVVVSEWRRRRITRS